MKKYLSLFLLALFSLILVGCSCEKKSEKELKNYYDKMQIGEDTINGYTIDLRLYGTYNNKRVSDIVRVDNYMNKQFRIDDNSKDILDRSDIRVDNSLYIIDGESYRVKNNVKEAVTEESVYTKTNIYLTTLPSASKVTNAKTEKLGEIEYTTYEFNASDESIKSIIEHTSLKGATFKDVKAKVYINSNNYVYKVIYTLNNELELSVCYFGINTAREINI